MAGRMQCRSCRGDVIRTGRAHRVDVGMWDFDYTFITAKRAADPALTLFPAVSRVQAQAKRWLESTAQGAASMAHLQDYLHAFEGRFNRRGASKPGLQFYRLLGQSVRHAPVTYDMVANPGSHTRDIHPTGVHGTKTMPASLHRPDAGRPLLRMFR